MQNGDPKGPLSSPNVLKLRGSSSRTIFFGLALFVPGLFMMFANDGDPKVPPYVFKLIAIPFLMGGAAFLLYRTFFIFDKSRDELTIWKGIFAPISERRHGKISAYRRVTINKIQIRSRNNYHYEYEVWLETEGPHVRRLHLATNEGYKITCHQVEAIANFLGITYSDQGDRTERVSAPPSMREY